MTALASRTALHDLGYDDHAHLLMAARTEQGVDDAVGTAAVERASVGDEVVQDQQGTVLLLGTVFGDLLDDAGIELSILMGVGELQLTHAATPDLIIAEGGRDDEDVLAIELAIPEAAQHVGEAGGLPRHGSGDDQQTEDRFGTRQEVVVQHLLALLLVERPNL